jgi:hypothetical protein
MRYIILLSLALLSSCSIQKRKYLDGFYISRTSTGTTPVKVRQVHETKPAVLVIHEKNVKAGEEPRLASASESRSVPAVKNSFGATPLILKDNKDSCDVLVFNNGNEISVKIREITAEEVRFHRCDMQDGPLFVHRKAELFMAKYANGTKEIFMKGSDAASTAVSAKPKDTRIAHPKTELALILAICGWVIGYGSIHSLILIKQIKRDMKAEPNKYKDQDLIELASALSIAKLVLLGLVLLILLLIAILAI